MALRAAAHSVNILMTYVALARKWRPRTFSQLVGQDHINKALINSLNQKRLHHAYLFTGTRGVGKTSVARLLAKALNCELGISAEPCLKCDACIAIEQGRFIDLIEIDGASRTRVEDTREILENVQYAPTNGRFKIYLIDEVHMLSQHSFNALLKTLEEPPAHVKFILATTDPQKLPVTVLSRCLQFNLRHLQPEVISNYLQTILDSEQLTYDSQALNLLATAARGSMRDALSLLDQAIACCSGNLGSQDVRNSLGYTQQDYALQVLEALAELDAQKLLVISKQIGEEGGHFRYVLDEILGYLHQISVTQTIPGNHPLISSSSSIQALSTRFTAEDAQLFYQIALKGSQEISIAPTMAIGFEMTLLRMYTFKPSAPATPPSFAYQKKITNEPNEMRISPAPEVLSPKIPVSLPEETPVPASRATENLVASQDTTAWPDILSQLALQGLALSAAENAEFISKSNGLVVLRVSKGHQSLFTPSVLSRIEQGLSKYYNEKISLNLNTDQMVSSTPLIQKQTIQKQQIENAEAALQNDPFFQQLQNEFSAEVVKNSISLLKDGL